MKTLTHFLALATPFWLDKQQWLAWFLLVLVIACSLAIVHVSVWITEWNKTFYDALAAFNGQMMPTLITQYLGYITLITAFIACGNWLRKILLFRWREHLTSQFEQHWLQQHQHYHLQLTGEPDNPDQRIAEDIYLLSEKSIDLFKYFIMNFAKLGAFITILWQLSGIQTFQLGGYIFTIHGYLVWIALIYSLACTLITHLIGRPLQILNMERQHREADYRATLLRIRDHSEQVALYHGETAEQHRLQQRFNHIKHNWHELIGREFKLESFTAAYLRINMFIPIIATLPMYLARSMTFGDMMQARSAFSNVQDGFGWFMDYYKRIIEWAAVVERLTQFQIALTNISHHNPTLPHITKQTQALLQIQHLTLYTAEGRILLQNIQFQAHAAEWILLDGKSGIGKSTLMRTLAGLWPYYQGHYQLADQHHLFLPQRPYLPQDSLRAVISYPYLPQQYSQQQFCHVLQLVGLAYLVQLLNSEREWHKILSGGEQQRLSLTRALLHRPTILFLDEATNQLDDKAAITLMQTLQSELPHTLCLAISHQSSVKALFTRQEDFSLFTSSI